MKMNNAMDKLKPDITVVSVSSNSDHTFSKSNRKSIRLIADIGVEGDAHSGKTVKHRYLVAKNPDKYNIRQVHLIQSELFDVVNDKGFSVYPGDLGENISTRGVDLLSLPTNTQLTLGEKAIIQLTALRNPCSQIENFQPGLLKELVYKDDIGNTVRKAGVMAIVLVGGLVYPGDIIFVKRPIKPYKGLEYIW